MTEPLLRVEHLVKEFPIRHLFRRNESVVAVDDVSFEVPAGSAIGLVGESGSGKTTTARCIMRLIEPTSGHIYFEGVGVAQMKGRDLSHFRRAVQLVFQDPYSSLNPRMWVEDIVAEGLRIHKLCSTDQQRRARVLELLELVGLEASHMRRKPSAFSSGQRQRIGIARALAVEPTLLICDEPVSSLDVSIQAQILNLFRDLQDKLGLTMLFIAHDLATVRYLCDYIVVMHNGRVVEMGTREQVYEDPQDPYTEELMAAVPIADPELERERRQLRRATTAIGNYAPKM